MKNILFFPLCALALCVAACKNKSGADVKAPETPKLEANVQLITHKEATDTLLADTSASLKSIQYKVLKGQTALELVQRLKPLEKMLVNTWPDNGFYGPDHYRIEFIITSVSPSAADPLTYEIKGKNRFKKTISAFSGKLVLNKIAEMTDPNLDTAEVREMGLDKMYSLSGVFKFDEDANLKTSGAFSGQFKMEFGSFKENPDEPASLWFFSKESETKGAGYIFEGNWQSYTQKDLNRPVLWARDLFQIANGIMKDFSYGEREVEINPKYRHLGWDEFWSGEEWWN